MQLTTKTGRRSGLLLTVVLSCTGLSCAAGEAFSPSESQTFWSADVAFSSSQYDPVHRALKLGLTPEMVNRSIDRGLGAAESCQGAADTEVGCQVTNLS